MIPLLTASLCTEHSSDCLFEIKSFREGDVIENKNLNINHLVFCIEGCARISSTLFHDEMLCSKEVMFIPHQCECRGVAKSDITLLIHKFNNTVCDAQKCILHYLSTYHNVNPQIYCSRLVMHPLLWLVANGVMEYIAYKTADPEMWQLKHREIIWIFTKCYTLKELQAFFYPISGEHVPFRTLVMTHFPKANYTEDLATLCGYPLWKFRRMFKAEFGISAHQWLIAKRSERVLYYLKQPSIQFLDIIELLNISSQQEFNRFCKKYLGGTPTDIRQYYEKNRDK